MTLRTTTQIAVLRTPEGGFLQIQEAQVRVIKPFLGGGFARAHRSAPALRDSPRCWRTARAPAVRLLQTRRETFLAHRINPGRR